MTKTNEEWVEEFQNKDHIITSDGGLYVAIDAHWLRTLLTEKDKEREEAVREIVWEFIRNPIRADDGVADYDFNMKLIDRLQALTPDPLNNEREV